MESYTYGARLQIGGERMEQNEYQQREKEKETDWDRWPEPWTTSFRYIKTVT